MLAQVWTPEATFSILHPSCLHDPCGNIPCEAGDRWRQVLGLRERPAAVTLSLAPAECHWKITILLCFLLSQKVLRLDAQIPIVKTQVQIYSLTC